MPKHGAGRPLSWHSGGQCGGGCSTKGCGETEDFPHIWDTDNEGTLMLFAGSRICVRCGTIERHLILPRDAASSALQGGVRRHISQ